MRMILVSTALMISLLGSGASPAFAAKGVKKKNTNASNGVHTAHGVVTHVDHKGKGAGHIGDITIKTHSTKRKGQPAIAGKKTTTATHRFTVGSNTQFFIAQGNGKRAAKFGSIRVGEHVAIVAKGKHAELVTIHMHAINKSKSLGKKTKKPAINKNQKNSKPAAKTANKPAIKKNQKK